MRERGEQAGDGNITVRVLRCRSGNKSSTVAGGRPRPNFSASQECISRRTHDIVETHIPDGSRTARNRFYYCHYTVGRRDNAGSSKVKLCHIPPDNPDNACVIEVSQNAVRDHLAHGDFVGACCEPTETTTNTLTSVSPSCRPGSEACPASFCWRRSVSLDWLCWRERR